MYRIVQKFGGTSVADTQRIKEAAKKVAFEHSQGHQVVVVVSAMAGVTNKLIEFKNCVNNGLDASEYDVVLSSGEQTSAALMALALQNMGVRARSWLGWQIPIWTDNVHGKARITGIETDLLENQLKKNEIVVVAGFQGLTPDKRITTLGRGGSDLTAVALAGALQARQCDIFTDVEGIYTCDPRIVSSANKLDKITYEEMMEMSSLGAKVLQTRAVELAMNYNVRIQVRSAFIDSPGTYLVSEDEIVEQQIVSGISHNRDEAKVTLLKVSDRPGVAAGVFGPLAEASVNVDMIVQNVSEDGKTTDLTFTVGQADLNLAVEVLETRKDKIGFQKIVADAELVKISIVGVGMRSHPGVAQTMFNALAKKGINIKVISTSEIKVSVLIDEEYTELALKALHSAYGLDRDTDRIGSP
ncbi:MAG TPA: aspartate kinase [Rhodospirillales bacterium]|jgi:aspartate kinase|nr:MAG: Aspartate kinase [Alphaproteobacteria bacterium MarineAlpha3_Bin6]HIM20969.1 aspartate kinase [Rhodospirillales bacterium]HIP10175.1 aspartate kinase [Rhodospirillales bacterium]